VIQNHRQKVVRRASQGMGLQSGTTIPSPYQAARPQLRPQHPRTPTGIPMDIPSAKATARQPQGGVGKIYIPTERVTVQ